jgi:hypothetical protein
MLAMQLEIYQRNNPKLKIHRIGRMFFSLMIDWLSNWKERMFIVKPATVIKCRARGGNLHVWFCGGGGFELHGSSR